ncbi:glucosamine-6-phosphate deaminase [Gramella sp. KN1008]|uniref:glucosamine-6-phosphate deaminase n=1 Tax=Gramella sp. KN1008 TaxID=2529298 RepID=UPI001038861E|nr:glucosamine-6-phosphate deaminase [Gramella sp. KN1008]TBW28630.1 glucosamine-6-phosphate deaminase [Gramella sp. KN1008]
MLDFNKDVNVFPTYKLTGIAAGKAIEKCILKLQKDKDTIRIIFAAAPSQDGMLEYLSSSSEITWKKIVAFNMDEYLGLPDDAPQLFSKYLEKHLFSKVELKKIHTIDPNNPVQEEVERFSRLIKEAPIDIVCLGIGENGHIAFNDPPVADFKDPEILKVVELDQECRMQQVNDGCFRSLDEVPKRALTLTIPALMNGNNLFCVVPGINKSRAVYKTFNEPVSTACPASILTTHSNCSYYFDTDSYKEIEDAQIDIENKTFK